MRRAIADESSTGKVGWSKRAMRARRERFGRMDGVFVEYERRAEKMEGLASYVEAQAINKSRVDHLDGEKAGEVRRTCCGSGHAMRRFSTVSLPGGRRLSKRKPVHPSTSCSPMRSAATRTSMSATFRSEREITSHSGLVRTWNAGWSSVARERRHSKTGPAGAYDRASGGQVAPGDRHWTPPTPTSCDVSWEWSTPASCNCGWGRAWLRCCGRATLRLRRSPWAPVPIPYLMGCKRAEFVAGEDWSVTEAQGSLKIAGRGIDAELQVSEWVEEGGAIRVLLAG